LAINLTKALLAGQSYSYMQTKKKQNSNHTKKYILPNCFLLRFNYGIVILTTIITYKRAVFWLPFCGSQPRQHMALQSYFAVIWTTQEH